MHTSGWWFRRSASGATAFRSAIASSQSRRRIVRTSVSPSRFQSGSPRSAVSIAVSSSISSQPFFAVSAGTVADRGAAPVQRIIRRMVEEATQPAPAEGAAEPQDEAAPIRLLEGDSLDPLVQSQCSLSVQLRRATGSIVGRSGELTAIAQAIREAKTRLNAVTLEGEPGIGKTRLLVATAEMTEAAGFTTVAITADEEIRGPFLVGRSLFANGAIRETALGTRAEVALRRVVEALAGRDEPGFENLTPEAKLLRTFDLAGIAIAELARVKPLA